MQRPELRENSEMRAYCPECKSICTFHSRNPDQGGNHYSSFSVNFSAEEILSAGKDENGYPYNRVIYHAYKCGGCGRGGMSASYISTKNSKKLKEFYPSAITHELLPGTLPEEIKKEYKEAEICFGNRCNRAASAMIRSTLEKILKANGYKEENANGFDNMWLTTKIKEATKDGVLTSARGERAKNDIKVLGDEVVHRDWREVTDEEVKNALQYALWIIRDLYDDRATTEEILQTKGRL